MFKKCAVEAKKTSCPGTLFRLVVKRESLVHKLSFLPRKRKRKRKPYLASIGYFFGFYKNVFSFDFCISLYKEGEIEDKNQN